MALLDQLVRASSAARILDLEDRESGETIKGDFEGSVTGFWVRLDERGAGIVAYNQKEYVTKPIGFTSLPAGTEVEMSYAKGIYYSKF